MRSLPGCALALALAVAVPLGACGGDEDEPRVASPQEEEVSPDEPAAETAPEDTRAPAADEKRQPSADRDTEGKTGEEDAPKPKPKRPKPGPRPVDDASKPQPRSKAKRSKPTNAGDLADRARDRLGERDKASSGEQGPKRVLVWRCLVQESRRMGHDPKGVKLRARCFGKSTRELQRILRD